MDANAELFQKWVQEGLIVLHYEGDLSKEKKLSTEPNDYNGPGKKVMRRLWEYCESGALVVADYSDYNLKEILLGILPPGSRIEPRKEPFEEYPGEYPEGVAYYKVVKLDACVRLQYADQRVRPLLVLQPRSGTVVRWSIGHIERYVKYLYKAMLHGTKSLSDYPPQDYPFTDYQWEVLCSEYLRTYAAEEIRIHYLLTPVGRTMKDIDIDGANKNTHILCQVSLTKNLEETEKKIQSLTSYSEEHYSTKNFALVYFGPKELEEHIRSKHPRIKFISTDEVLEALKTRGIIEDMLPF